MRLHALDVAAVDVDVAAVVVVVVVGADAVDAAARVVVVTCLGVVGLLLHAAKTMPAHATKASAQRGAVTFEILGPHRVEELPELTHQFVGVSSSSSSRRARG